MRRSLVIIATSLILWAMIAQVNHYLSAVHIYVFVGGLFVTYAAINFPLGIGLTASVVSGIFCDAAEPVTFGTFVILYSAAHTVIFNIRNRLPRDDTMTQVIVALFANLGVYLSLCFIQIIHAPGLAGAWPRILADLIISQICLAIISPWFFAMQSKALTFVAEAPDRIF